MSSGKTKDSNTKSKRGFRLPIRFQISFLLAFFLVIMAFGSMRATMDFLKSDKVVSVREIQVLRIADLSRAYSDRLDRARAALREAAFRLLDPQRGTVVLDAEDWKWVEVQGKVWPTGADTQNSLSRPAGLETFGMQLDESLSEIIFFEPLKVVLNGVESIQWIRAKAKLSVLAGEKKSLDEGLIKGVAFDTEALTKAKNADDVYKAIWVGSPEARSAFSKFYLSLPDTWKSDMHQNTKAQSKEFKPSPDESSVLISESVVTESGSLSKLKVLTFVNQDDLLKAFKLFVTKQTFSVIIVLVIGIFCSGILARYLSRPMEALVKATGTLEKGDFKVRVDSKRPDELGDLARAFNHMGQALEEREDALKGAQAALVQNEKLAALGTLSAGIAHEVKNPLAGVLGNADLATIQIKKLHLPNEDQVLRYIEVIQKETKRCRGIIDSLMRFSRQEKAEFLSVDLELVAWEAVHLMEHSLNMQKVIVEKNFDESLWLIEGNANQIEQVILNMLQNGGHAMPEGGKIVIGTKYFPSSSDAPVGPFLAYKHDNFQGAFSRIFIQDFGVGMSLEVQKKIFEPFFTTKPKGVGTGLGLSVTMGILAEHKARISIDSQVGKGTTFLIDFMAKEKRSKDIIDQLHEIHHRRSGGQALASDAGVKPAARAPVDAPAVPVDKKAEVGSPTPPLASKRPPPPVTPLQANAVPAKAVVKKVGEGSTINEVIAEMKQKPGNLGSFQIRKPKS